MEQIHVLVFDKGTGQPPARVRDVSATFPGFSQGGKLSRGFTGRFPETKCYEMLFRFSTRTCPQEYSMKIGYQAYVQSMLTHKLRISVHRAYSGVLLLAFRSVCCSGQDVFGMQSQILKLWINSGEVILGEQSLIVLGEALKWVHNTPDHRSIILDVPLSLIEDALFTPRRARL